MTPYMKNVPAPAATGNEDNEQFSNFTPVIAYLHRRTKDTHNTYGTWSGEQLDMNTHVMIVVPVETACPLFADNPHPVTVNRACLEAQSAAARSIREEQRAKDLERRRACVIRHTTEDVTYSVDLLDALTTDAWTNELDRAAREFLADVLDRDIDEVTAELLTEARHALRRNGSARLAELDQETNH